MTGLIVKKRAPYPFFAGSMPSTSGGRRVNVIAGVDADGSWNVEKEDVGAESVQNAPILFVPFGGVDYALTMGDLKEMMAGMRESHQKWRDKQPVRDLTKDVKNFAEAIIHKRNGRKVYHMKEGIKND